MSGSQTRQPRPPPTLSQSMKLCNVVTHKASARRANRQNKHCLALLFLLFSILQNVLPPPTWRSCKCNQVGLFVSGSVCEQNYHKSNQPISWYYDWVYQSEELISFSGDLFQIRISYHFSTSLNISELNSSKNTEKGLEHTEGSGG